MAVNIAKKSGSTILLDVAEFAGGSGILDENSLNAQKAFKDINDRLDLADQTFDGMMSSADKIKLDNIENEYKKMALIFG